MILKLDHIALRLQDKEKAKNFLSLLGYLVEDVIELDFGDSKAESYVLANKNLTEVFMSDGEATSVVGQWVNQNGPGIHHIAYQTDNIKDDVDRFKKNGVRFTTEDVLECDDLKQIFTVPQESLGGIIIELIERKTKGFCTANVKKLMESTKVDEERPYDYKRYSED